MVEEGEKLDVAAIKAGLDCEGVWSAGPSRFELYRGEDGVVHFTQDLRNGTVVTGRVLRVGSATPKPNCWTWEAKLNNGAEIRMKRHGAAMMIASRLNVSEEWSRPEFAARMQAISEETAMRRQEDLLRSQQEQQSSELVVAGEKPRLTWSQRQLNDSGRILLRQAAIEENFTEGAFNMQPPVPIGSRSIFKPKRLERIKQLLESKAADKAAAGSGTKGNVEPISLMGGESVLHPLSFNEEHMLQLYVSDPYNLSYNLCMIVALPVSLDARGLEHVIDIFTQRHIVFNSVYRYGDRNQPVRSLKDKFPGSVLKLAVSKASKLQKILAMEMMKPMPLGASSARFSLIPSEGGVSHICVNAHHIVADADSMAIMTMELRAIATCVAAGYNDKEMNDRMLPKIPVSFIDFAYWHQKLAKENLLVEDLAWCYYNVVASSPPLVLDLPIDRPRPRIFVATGEGIRMHVAQELLSPMAEYGATPFGAALAAFGICLGRMTGREKLCIGIPFALRPVPSVGTLVSNFLNMIPCRINADPKLPYQTYVRRVALAALGVQKHALAPFMNLVSQVQKHTPIQDPSRNPMYQTMVDMVPCPNPDSDEASAGLSGILDLFLFVQHVNGNVTCVDAIYNNTILRQDSVRALLLKLRQVMVLSARSPKEPLPLMIGSREEVQLIPEEAEDEPMIPGLTVKAQGNEYTVNVHQGFIFKTAGHENVEGPDESSSNIPPLSRFVKASGLQFVGVGTTSSTMPRILAGADKAPNVKEMRISPEDGKAYKFSEILDITGDPEVATKLWSRSKTVLDRFGVPAENLKRRRPHKKMRQVPVP